MSPLDRHCGRVPLHPPNSVPVRQVFGKMESVSAWSNNDGKARKGGRKTKVREGQTTDWEDKAMRDACSSLHFLS